MSKHTIYLYKKDLIRMLEIVEKFQEYENKPFKIEYNSCEIGETLDMFIETTIEEINGELRIPIVDVTEW